MRSRKFWLTLGALLLGVVGGLAGVALLDWLLSSRHRRKDAFAVLLGIVGGFVAVAILDEIEASAQRRKREGVEKCRPTLKE